MMKSLMIFFQALKSSNRRKKPVDFQNKTEKLGITTN